MQQLPESMKATFDELCIAISGFSAESDFQTDLGNSLKQLKNTLLEVEELAAAIKAKPKRSNRNLSLQRCV